MTRAAEKIADEFIASRRYEPGIAAVVRRYITNPGLYPTEVNVCPLCGIVKELDPRHTRRTKRDAVCPPDSECAARNRYGVNYVRRHRKATP